MTETAKADQQAKPTGLALMRAEFPAHQVSKLPKESRQQIDERKQNRNAGINCSVCGSWHHRNAVHLDYVGHAAITNRLLDVDPNWSWEPVAFGADGLPALDKNGGLWIRLTVCGVTRLGYGDAPAKVGGDAMKEAIGDALRNAAMRFGAGLELWHKGDLFLDEEHGDLGDPDDGRRQSGSAEAGAAPEQNQPPPPVKRFYSDEQFDANMPTWKKLIETGKRTHDEIIKTVEAKAPLTDAQKKKIQAVKAGKPATQPAAQE